MTHGPRLRLSDKFFGKVSILLVTSAWVAWLLTEGDGDPFWLEVVATGILVLAFVGAYELLGVAAGRVIGWTPLSSARRMARQAAREAAFPERPHFRAGQASVMLGAYVSAQVLVGVAIVVVATSGGSETADLDHLASIVGPAIPIGLLVGALVIWRLFRRFARTSPETPTLKERIGWKRPQAVHLLVASAAGVVLGVGLIILTRYVPLAEDVQVGALARAAQTPGLPQLGWATGALLLAPPIEEFLFRGLLFEGFRQSWGAVRSGVVVTAVFLLLHLAESWFYWPAMLGLTVVAILLLVTRVWTDSLAPPMALHFFYNLTLAALVFGLF